MFSQRPQGGNKTSPPDLLPLVARYFPANRAQFFGPTGLAIALGLFAAWSSWYTVPSDSVAVVQRFGKFVAETGPGLHFRIPFGIDATTLVPVKRQMKLEFGFATEGATNPDQGSRESDLEASMVTGDLNVSVVEWVVQYRIADAEKYLFHVREPGSTLRDATEAVMREVVGDRTVDEVLTVGRQEIESESLNKLKRLVDLYGLGIVIDQVQLKNINPPNPVRASFNAVNQAQQEREKLINEARRDYNREVPLAEGQKDQKIREAEGYRLKRVNEAEGDVARFNAVFEQYRTAPDVTRRRLYLETMQSILPGVRNKIVVDESMKGVLPLLNLGKNANPIEEKK